MAILPQDSPLFQEAYYNAPDTIRLDRFPPASPTEELTQFGRRLSPRLLILLDAAIIAVTFWAVAMLIWTCVRLVAWSDSQGVAVLAAIGCAVVIYAAFGRKERL